MEIVVLDGQTLNPGDLSWKSLAEIGDLTVHEQTDSDEIIDRIGTAEIVFTNKTPLTGEIFSELPQIKYVGILATGYNVIDIGAAKEHDVVVTNVPNYGTAAVAQHAISLLLELSNSVGDHNQSVKSGSWQRASDFCFWNDSVMELADKTMGIIGYGNIGQQTGNVAQALGMNVLAVDREQKPELETATMGYTDLDQLLAESDVISLHCPLLESTRGIINKDTIKKMKDEVLIINTARGELIVESDLAEALNQGWVAGAALDVLAEEPPDSSNPLLTAENIIITPHIAWAAQESRQRLLDIAVDNLQSFLVGDSKNIVK